MLLVTFYDCVKSMSGRFREPYYKKDTRDVITFVFIFPWFFLKGRYTGNAIHYFTLY